MATSASDNWQAFSIVIRNCNDSSGNAFSLSLKTTIRIFFLLAPRDFMVADDTEPASDSISTLLYIPASSWGCRCRLLRLIQDGQAIRSGLFFVSLQR